MSNLNTPNDIDSERKYDIRFKLCSNVIVAGPSQSGKTSLITEIIKNKKIMFDTIPKRVVWCSNESIAPTKEVDVKISGLPDLELIQEYDLVI